MKQICQNILNVLDKPRNRREIMELIHKPQTSVNDALRKLLDAKLILKFREEREILGRPKEFYCRREGEKGDSYKPYIEPKTKKDD